LLLQAATLNRLLSVVANEDAALLAISGCRGGSVREVRGERRPVRTGRKQAA
jgi:hypothetical protein